jgi:AraC family transcriptional regulator
MDQPGHSSGAALPPKAGALAERRLCRVLEYIEQRLEEDVTIDSLAAVVYLSKYHFSRAFKVSTGMSPKRYLKQRRLEKAKAMLAEEAGTLAEIAKLCRFSSAANFSRAFRSVTGFTPGRYRRTFTTSATRLRRYLAGRVEAACEPRPRS